MLLSAILPLARLARCVMLVSLIGARCGMPYAALPSSCSGAMYLGNLQNETVLRPF